jgi:hypothetical protein
MNGYQIHEKAKIISECIKHLTPTHMIVEHVVDVDGCIVEEYDIYDLSLGVIIESWQTFEEAMQSLNSIINSK